MAHSYSGLKQFETCAAQYKFSRIDRLPQPTGPAAERGKMLHAEIESVLNGELGLLSEEISYLEDYLAKLRDNGATPEVPFAIDRNWQEVDFKDPDAWLRGIIDLYATDGPKATILDWKSGKKRDYSDQVKVYATAVLSIHPSIQEIAPSIYFIDLKKEVTYSPIYSTDLPQLQRELKERLDAIDNEKIFAPNPSTNCRWCHYRKENGGPCRW